MKILKSSKNDIFWELKNLFLSNKKGFVTHPVVLFFVGVVIGLVMAYFWVNYVPTIPNPFCAR